MRWEEKKMNWKLGAFISFMLVMLASSATACHYFCGPNEMYDISTPADINAYPGQTLHFTVTGMTTGESWYWTAHNENGWLPFIDQGATPFDFEVPLTPCGTTKYYTVVGTGTVGSGDLACIDKICYKIKVKGDCPTCPTIPGYCYGESEFTESPLKVTLPAWMAGATCTWTFDNGDIVTGNPATYTGWDTLTVGTHTVKLTIKIGNLIVFECTITFTVRPVPTGTPGWSSTP